MDLSCQEAQREMRAEERGRSFPSLRVNQRPVVSIRWDDAKKATPSRVTRNQIAKFKKKTFHSGREGVYVVVMRVKLAEGEKRRPTPGFSFSSGTRPKGGGGWGAGFVKQGGGKMWGGGPCIEDQRGGVFPGRFTPPRKTETQKRALSLVLLFFFFFSRMQEAPARNV